MALAVDGEVLTSALDSLLVDSDMEPTLLEVPGLRPALERALERARERRNLALEGERDQGAALREEAEEMARLVAREAEMVAEVMELRSRLQKTEETEAETRKRAVAEAERSRRDAREAELEAEVMELRGRLQERDQADAEAASRLQQDKESSEAETKMREAELQSKVQELEVRLQADANPTQQDVPEGEAVRWAEREAELLEHLREAEGEAARRAARQAELEAEVVELEHALRSSTDREASELEELAAALTHRDERIEELQEALRESVRITANEETRRKQIMETVAKLEQRLLSLQTAYAIRCPTCRPLLQRVQELERQAAEWRRHLAELSHMKQEALEATISEKDAHLALLEVSGLRTAKQADEAERLKADRSRLMERLKIVNEESVKLSLEPCDYVHDGSVGDVLSRTTALSLDTDHPNGVEYSSPVKVNGCAKINGQMSPDSTESPDISTTSSPDGQDK